MSFVGMYFDDVIVFSKNEVEHWKLLARFFVELNNHSLVTNGKKSEVFLEEINFFGHIISNERVYGSC